MSQSRDFHFRSTIIQIRSSQTFFLQWLTRWVTSPCATRSREESSPPADYVQFPAIYSSPRSRKPGGTRVKSSPERRLWALSILFSKKRSKSRNLIFKLLLTHWNLEIIKDTPLCVMTPQLKPAWGDGGCRAEYFRAISLSERRLNGSWAGFIL